MHASSWDHKLIHFHIAFWICLLGVWKERGKLQKFKYLENEKSFLDKIIEFFEGISFGQKIKNRDTRFMYRHLFCRTVVSSCFCNFVNNIIAKFICFQTCTYPYSFHYHSFPLVFLKSNHQPFNFTKNLIIPHWSQFQALRYNAYWKMELKGRRLFQNNNYSYDTWKLCHYLIQNNNNYHNHI